MAEQDASAPASDVSSFKIYSLGKVAENKVRSENKIKVTPFEPLNMLDGEIKSNPEQLEVEGTDAAGEQYTSSITTDNTLEADWWPFSPGNQATAPDVRRGETVLLWRLGDSNEFYWMALGLDNDLRKLETVVMMYSATQDEAEETLTADNSYVLTVSSHDKLLSLSTSKANGEYTRWNAQFNLADGRFIITEDNGHEISIDVPERQIVLLNPDMSRIVIDKTNIDMYCDDDFSMTAGKTISLECKDYKLNAQTVTVNANNVTYKSNSVMMDTPTMEVTGELKTGNKASIGGLTIENGVIKCTGIESTGPVRAPNIN